MIHSEAIEFKGIVFRRYPNSRLTSHRNYYRPHSAHCAAGVQALHQEIWKAAHGPIPEGLEIHHKDGNPLNNALSNLEPVTKAEHVQKHLERGDYAPSSKQLVHLAKVRHMTKAWHSSPEGLAWHSTHSKEIMANRVKTPRPCQECGKEFLALWKKAKFCSGLCAGRARRKDPANWVEKTCVVCLTSFQIFKCEESRSNRKRQLTCSKVCGGIMRSII
jgi:hypothetical protein